MEEDIWKRIYKVYICKEIYRGGYTWRGIFIEEDTYKERYKERNIYGGEIYKGKYKQREIPMEIDIHKSDTYKKINI